MQNYGVCNIKVLRDYKRVTHGRDIIKKYVLLLLCAMVKLEEIKDMPKGPLLDHFSGNNREILWAVCGSDYNRFIGEAIAMIVQASRYKSWIQSHGEN